MANGVEFGGGIHYAAAGNDGVKGFGGNGGEAGK